MTTKIRVLHVVYTLGTGGLEKGVATIIRNSSPDLEHAVFCLSRSGSTARLLPEGTPVVEFDKAPGNSPLFIWQVARAIRKFAPHVVHSRNWSAIDGVLSARLAGIRNVVHGEHGWGMDDPQGLNPRRLWIRRFLARWVKEYTCVSGAMVPWLENTVRVGRPVNQIYNGVDPEQYCPAEDVADARKALGIEPDVPVVGVVGRLDPIKDHPTLFRAFARVRARHPGAWLLVVGKGPEQEALERCAGEGVRFLGNRLDTPEILRALDLFVLPSKNEGISNTILEAMATGLPVVASRVGGNPELVVEGGTGRLFPAGAEGPLSELLLEYFDRADLRHAHGRAGRERVLREFTVERMVREYETVYRRVAGVVAEQGVREAPKTLEGNSVAHAAARPPGGALKVAAARSLLAVGADRAVRWWCRHKALVLMYHGVTTFRHDPPRWTQLPVDLFRDQLRWVREHYEVVSLDVFRQALAGGPPLPERAALITFDDGLRNNREVALPVLEELGLPATIFLTVDLVGSDRLLWFDRLYLQIKEAVRRGQTPSSLRRWGLPPDPGVAYRRIGARLMRVPPAERRAILGGLDEEVPLSRTPEVDDYRLLGWEDVDALARSGRVSFGAHTATHEVLTGLDDAGFDDEVMRSIEALASRRGAPVRAFAYPNGRFGADFDRRHQQRLRALGVECAFATNPGLFAWGVGDPMAIPRVSVGADLTSHPAYFRLVTSAGGAPRRFFHPRRPGRRPKRFLEG